MMKRLAPTLILPTLFALFVTSAPARQEAKKPEAKENAPLVVTLGERKVNIPAPQGYEEGAAQFPLLKEMFSKTEPEGVDLLAVYLPHDVAAAMRANGGKYEGLRVFHGKVSVDRQFRAADCSPADFEQLVSTFRAQAPKAIRPGSSLMKGRLKELEKTLGELDTGVTRYGISESEALGELEAGPNVYSFMFFFRMQVEAKGEKRSLPRLTAGSFVRVNRRLLYIYTYRNFKSEADADALAQFTRDWMRQIVAANPSD